MQDKADIETIATTLSGGSPGLRLAWRKALETIPEPAMAGIHPVLAAFPSPDCARTFGLFLSREADPLTALEAFVAGVDESPESLEDWLKAFEIFACYIDSTAHRPSLGQATGYLHCCASLAHGGSHYSTFPMAVEAMLESYGYAGGES